MEIVSSRRNEPDKKPTRDQKKNAQIQKLVNEKKELFEKLQKYESIVSRYENEHPEFLFSDNAENQDIYFYLREHPDSSKFIYKTYVKNRNMIERMCDSESPLYIPQVAENLKEIYQVKTEKEELDEILKDIQRYKSERSNQQTELEKIKQYVKDKEEEMDQIEENLERMKKEEEEYSRQKANIRSDKGLELIKKNSVEVLTLFDTIETLRNEERKRGNVDSVFGVRIDNAHLELISKLQKDISDMLKLIETEDFLSPEYLDEYRKKQMENFENVKREFSEKIEKESVQAENNIKYFLISNPQKNLDKSINAVEKLLEQVEIHMDVRTGETRIPKLDADFIRGDLGDALKLLNNMRDGLERVKKKK